MKKAIDSNRDDA